MSAPALSHATPRPGSWTGDAPATTRYRCDLAASCRPVAAWLARDRNSPATISELSTRDLGLMVGRRFEAGAGLGVQLPPSAAQCDETLLVKVVRVEPQPGGQWLHRCALISELAEDTVAALVGPDAVRKARAEGERSAAGAKPATGLRRSLSRVFCVDGGAAERVRLGVLVVAMLGLGVSAGLLLRLLR
jgi:hypothetical protein